MPYTSDSWTFGHVPTTFKRLPTVNRWGVLHGFYSDQRDDQELSNSAPDMPSGVGFRILANRGIWEFPNISGALFSIGAASEGCFTTSSKALEVESGVGYEAFKKLLDLSKANAIYGSSSTVQVSSLKGYFLIRSYQA